MRLDKYLKVSRILKRRTVSKELAENRRVSVNGKTAKPAHDVKVGDTIEIVFGRRKLEIKVLSVEEVKKKKDAVDMYEIISETIVEKEETEEL